jgi:ATP-binding cassette subfamily B protein
MNKFHATLVRAVARLEGDDKDRRALYERARGALIRQMIGRDPPLTKTEIMRERLLLEEAIALVEAETTRRQQEALHPKTDSAAPVPDRPPPRQGSVPPAEKAAAAALRKQPLNPAPSQRHEGQIEQSNASAHDARPAADQHRQLQHAPADAGALASRLQPVIQAARHQIGRIIAKPIQRQPEAPNPNPVSAPRAPNEPPAEQGSSSPVEKAAAAAPPKQSLSLAPSQPPEEPIEHDKGLVASSADQHIQSVSATQHGPAGGGARLPSRLQAMIQAARYQGIELDPNEFRHAGSDTVPSAASLSLWAQNAGMWSRAVRIRWQHLPRLNDSGPVVLLFTDGTAGLLTGTNAAQAVVYLKDPYAPAGTAPVAVDQLRLSEVWAGEAVLLRVVRGYTAADALFNFRWLVDLVLQERRSLRDIGIASLTISVLTIFPPLLVMMMVNKVLQFHSVSTLVLLCAMMLVVVIYETLLGYGRRLIISVIGARLDAKLNLHLFNRLLRLPLDYFERHPPGETMYQIAQIHRVRDFLTGKLLETFLDLITLCVLLPFLFYLNTILASIVLVCAAAITLIILAYLKPLRVLYSRVTTAETWKSAALGETIVGIKTVKALALEPQRRALWDERIAEAGKWHLAFAQLANWPQTLVTPIQRMMVMGTLMLGAYMAMNDPSGYMVGGLFAFMMLSGRVSQPLVGLARLVEDYEEVGAAIGEAGSVLNRPLETVSGAVGLRPKLVGAISFEDVTFTYTGTKVPALDRVSFSIPAGTMLGIVGRSGSGKSTITRLLQGINRDYGGYLKIDGADLREIDLRHLRQNLGVVLQNNFLFRGSVRDNIIAGRPGLTLTDAVYAARLAGAEEFIERMPNGYETYIEEGSPNLSGGQTQRLAIARALIHNPRILILDEATSALDPESEAAVTANLQRIAQGRTMVLVSHRLSSLMECDQILVMEEGKVADIGPHSALLERCPLYRQLWAQQHRHLESQGPRHGVVAPRLVPGA